jgi:hypothetical protein
MRIISETHEIRESVNGPLRLGCGQLGMEDIEKGSIAHNAKVDCWFA